MTSEDRSEEAPPITRRVKWKEETDRYRTLVNERCLGCRGMHRSCDKKRVTPWSTGARVGPACRSVHAFTLVEVIAALTISAMLLVSVVSTTRALSSTRQNVERRVDQRATARHAMETIVAALRNVRRDPAKERPVVIGRSGGRGSGNDRIDLLVISDVRGRPEGAESDQYEQSFYLAECPGRPGLVLLSRKDHALDDHPQEGGVGTIVAEGMMTLSFTYYSGAEWRDEWSDLEVRAPQAVRVTLSTMPANLTEAQDSGEPAVLSTIVALHANEPVDDRAADRKRREEASPGPGPSPGGPPS